MELFPGGKQVRVRRWPLSSI